ncbi:MAG: hypothetical protein SH850_18035 [Planctomycetaceae bacterium]|nr:hypothetical protein [Planctomycetaceae bacterium]
MNLTAAQIEAIKDGEPVRVTSPEIGTACVVLRADVFDRVQRVVDYGDMPPEEAYPALLEAWDADGSPQDAENFRRAG